MYEQQQRHEMILEKTHPTGAEEWYCPTCGRRMLFRWRPEFRRIVLEPGDEYAQHSGSKGGLRIGPVQVTQVAEDEISEENLRVWREALEDIEFDDWGDEKAA